MEALTTIVDNGNGTFTYTDEDGTATTFDAKIATVLDNADGTYTIVAEATDTSGNSTTRSIQVTKGSSTGDDSGNGHGNKGKGKNK